MKYLILILIGLLSTFYSFGQAGIYKTENDFKSGKLNEIGEFDTLKNGKLFFIKDGEEVKVKRNEYYGFMDNEGYLYRFAGKKSNRVYKLHVKGSVCVWGVSMDSEFLDDTGDYYIIKCPSYPYVSKNMTSELFAITYSSYSDIGKLIRADNKLYRTYKKIKKKTIKSDFTILHYVIYFYNQRKPLKKGFVK